MEQCQQWLVLIKRELCPHCKCAGTLNRHGFLRGYDSKNIEQKAIQAIRVFCSNRGKHRGCGRTFSVWMANKIQRCFLDASEIWAFLRDATDSGNRKRAFEPIKDTLTLSAPYRIWKRFLEVISNLRTQLCRFCEPPKPPESPEFHSEDHAVAWVTVQHLIKAFRGDPLNPIAAFQFHTGTFFF